MLLYSWNVSPDVHHTVLFMVGKRQPHLCLKELPRGQCKFTKVKSVEATICGHPLALWVTMWSGVCNLLFSFLQQNVCCPRQFKTNTLPKKENRWTYGFSGFFFFFYRGIMFITSMPSPLNLLQLANIIYCLVMDDTGVAETHLAKQDEWAYSIPLRFLRDSSLALWMEILPKREGKRCKHTWCCTVRERKR